MNRDRSYAAVWGIAGLGWLANGLLGLDAVNGTSGFYATEVAWLPVHALVLVGLLGLRRTPAIVESALGRAGIHIAIGGRVVFLAAEITAIAVGYDELALLPVAAVSTGLGMLIAGAAVVRARRWQGWARWAPVAMGAYPFIFMFPILAITGKRPNLAVSLWGLTYIGIAAALAAQMSPAHRSFDEHAAVTRSGPAATKGHGCGTATSDDEHDDHRGPATSRVRTR
ncbi:MAG: hypothetical protein ABI949_08665 [Ilumatobacteraceae bacterium]